MNLTVKRLLYKTLGSRLVYNPVYRLTLNNLIKLKSNPKLNVVMAESTNLCNLKCEFCFRDVMKRKQGLMDNYLASKIINQINCDISLQGCGEPLLDKYIFDKIEMVKQRKLKLFLSTNGVLLNETISDNLVKSGLDVLNISIDSNSDETYAKIHHCSKGVFEQLTKKIDYLLKIKDKLTVELVFKCYNSNKGEEAGFLKRWNSRASVLMGLNTFKWYGTEFKDNIPEKRLMRFPCWFLWNTLFINWDGTVPLCCHDYDCQEQIGDVTKESIENIFKNMQYKREEHLAGIYTSVCADCKINSQYANPEWWWR